MSKLTPDETRWCADQLWNAQRTGKPCAPLTARHAGITPEEAYAIQAINVRRRTHERGLRGGPATRIGLKIGLTSKAVQDWLGVGEPDFGFLLSDMVIADGDTGPLECLLQPRAEGEIAFVLQRDLSGPGVTAADVLQATDFILPAIEVVDSRVLDWKVKYADTVADNASSGMFVLGTTPVSPRGFDFRHCGMSLSKRGRVVSTGAGAACLANPVNAVAWLANTFGALGTELRAGEVILSGALGPVTPVAEGDTIEVAISGLGAARAVFSRSH
jgi:2-oxopent-4-enoate hydratase